MALSRSKQEFFENNGWSSHYFIEHAKLLVPELEQAGYTLDFGRHVIHLIKDNQIVLKFYVHKGKRTREYLTVTNGKGNELLTVHYSEDPANIKHTLFEILQNENNKK